MSTTESESIINGTAQQQSSNNNNNSDACVKTADILSLDSIRHSLIRQEETIIFALIERAKYRTNDIVYRPGGFGSLGVPPGSTVPEDNNENDNHTELSFLEYFLVGTEVLHCSVRRYTSPEEHAFFPERLPAEGPMKALPKLDYPQELLSSVGGASAVNINKRLLDIYQSHIVPNICPLHGDDEQHGSTVLADIAVLQALSRRIHYGKFVAESKYLANPEAYQQLVDNNNADGVMQLLTNTLVEAQVLRRARLKATTYGTEPILVNDHDDDTSMVAAAAASAVAAALETLRSAKRLKGKVDPLVIENIYRDIIIPMTKDVEVAYLFRRCGKTPPPPYDI